MENKKYLYKYIVESNFDNLDVSEAKVTLETNDESVYNHIEHIVSLLICQGFNKKNILNAMCQYIENQNSVDEIINALKEDNK
jgi:hypothetical protein